MTFIPNYHWNHTKFNFGTIPVVIWYEYHTSVFAVYVLYYIVSYMQLDIIIAVAIVPAAKCTSVELLLKHYFSRKNEEKRK